MNRGRANPIASQRTSYLVDTDVFILWQHHHQVARKFFRRPPGPIYYSKQTRKELLHPFLSGRERRRIVRFLKRFRLVNPDERIASAFSDLLSRYPYLGHHLGDALIAATAWVKDLSLVTGNVGHFAPIEEIRVAGFPGDFGS